MSSLFTHATRRALTTTASSSSSELKSNKRLIISLYRALLRTTKPFSHPPHGKVLSSLLHRKDDFDWGDAIPSEIEYELREMRKQQRKNNNKSSSLSSTSTNDQDNDRRDEQPLPIHVARNLSLSYDELRDIYQKTNNYDDDIDPDDDDDDGFQKYGYYYGTKLEFHKILIRQLWKEVFNDDTALMRFPSHISYERDVSLMDIVKREFRLKEDDDDDDETMTTTVKKNVVAKDYKMSTRLAAAFLALKVLNEKLAWATSQFDRHSSSSSSSSSSDTRTKNTTTTTTTKTPILPAPNVSPLPLYPPTSYLRPGTYLVAHPLLTGYFRRTVVLILDHDDGTTTTTTTTSSSTSSTGPSHPTIANASVAGGTYGLIINRTYGDHHNRNNNNNPQRQTMETVIRPDMLPDPLRMAFGRCAVKDGGPVNPSIQMIYASDPNSDERWDIGGRAIPRVSDTTTTTTMVSDAWETDRAIYCRGDLIKASRAVVDGDMKREDFSFYVGASCWDVGQLESEIERGFWLPAGGPPRLALGGGGVVVEEGMMGVRVAGGEGGGEEGRRTDELYLSMLGALGEEEARLAHLLSDDDYVESSKACDDF